MLAWRNLSRDRTRFALSVAGVAVVSMAVDPVCGMSVERERAVVLERGGKQEYFCSKGCRDEFLGAHRTPRPDLDGDQAHGTGADDPGERYSTGVSGRPDLPAGDAT